MKWYSEEDDGFQSLGYKRTKESLELVHSPTLLTRKGRDGDLGARQPISISPIERGVVGIKAKKVYLGVWLVSDEDGVHEHVLCEMPFGLESSEQRVVVASLQVGRNGRGHDF